MCVSCQDRYIRSEVEPTPRIELGTSFLPRTRSTTELCGPGRVSELGSCALRWCRGQDSNLRSRKATDLQSAGFNHSPTPAQTTILTYGDLN